MKIAFCKQIDYTRDIFGNGSEVYYKRNNNNTYKEPGNVHGQDDAIIFKRQAQLFFHIQFKGELINQSWENGKKTPYLRLDFGLFDANLGPQFFLGVLPLLVVKHYFKLSSYAIYRKTSEPNFRKWQKKLILGLILVWLGPNLVHQFFFRGCYLY